jgi:excisionase family DNA binding protein
MGGLLLVNSNTVQQPATYRVEDIQRLLGIGRNSAYGLIKQDGFPCIRVGSRVIIPSDLFHAWVSEQAGKGAAANAKG